MKKIEVRDIVRVTDWGKQYSIHTEWFNEHRVELNLNWIIRYAYNDRTHYEEHKRDDNTRYLVLFVDTWENKALITSDICHGSVYLVDTSCLELCDTPTEIPTEMTIAEIEKLLGIKNLKIIKEK